MKVYGRERIKHGSEHSVADSLEKIDVRHLDGRISYAIASVRIPAQRGKEIEIDFLLVGKSGLFVLEVKGGEISIRNGIWYTTNHSGDTNKINPLEQAQDNYYRLWEFLHSKGIRSAGNAQVGLYACVFPAIKFTRPPDSGWVQEQFLDNRFMIDPTKYLKELVDYKDARFHRSEISSDAINGVLDLLVPDYESYVTDLTSAADDAIFRLSEEQIEILRALSDNKRMVIEGPPGSGKTVLAIGQLIQNEFGKIRTLYVCHNRAIKNKVKAEVNRRLGSIPKYIDFNTDSEAKNSRATYDYLVLDEAQDYMNDETFIELDERHEEGLDGGRYRIYLDLNQDLFSSSETSLLNELKTRDDVLSYKLRYNYRNTININKYAKKLSSLNAGELRNNPEGVEPEICKIPYIDDLVDYKKYTNDVLGKIKELLGTGTRQDEIMIVSMSGNDKSIMSDRNLARVNVGGLKFVLGRDHDWSKAKTDTIVIGNVYDLKGLDSKVVILTDVFTKIDREKALLVGVTRARSRIIIFQGKNI